ncbi:type II toxin-antitoxin system Phd/YefM family antitoxin [Desulfobacterota bacterium AH_259_B03_O07]|nr:type II toxin-antitoxin system Phd/YefM family antitoxin [Desulfobacterota bacterium AH_259_B03_O07]
MIKTVNVHEAKTHLSKILSRVLNGEEIVISKAGKPVARLVPIIEKKKNRKPGTAINKIQIKKDFEAPLPKYLIKQFEK